MNGTMSKTSLDLLQVWARERGLEVDQPSPHRVTLCSPGSTEPLVERRGESPEKAAFYIINVLERLGAWS